MSASMLVVGLIVLALLTLFIVGIVVTVVLLTGRRSKPVTSGIPEPRPTTSTEGRRQQREEILEKLAAQEMSREDAESALLELDKPLPEQMPLPPQTRSGCGGAGCLIVAVVAALVVVVLFVAVLFLFIAVS